MLTKPKLLLYLAILVSVIFSTVYVVVNGMLITEYSFLIAFTSGLVFGAIWVITAKLWKDNVFDELDSLVNKSKTKGE